MRVTHMIKPSVIIAITTALTLLGVTGIAAADNPPSPPNPATGKSGPPNISAAAAAVAFDCQIKANYPHRSFHFPETVDGDATASCTPGVFSITMIVTIWRVNTPFPDTPAGTSLPAVGSYQVNALASGPCISGTYYTAADAVVIFPPGAVPPFGAIGNFTPPQQVNC